MWCLQVEHEGTHSHTTNTNAVHFCETRCHSCGYFCNLPINHTGLHNTTHGNMTDVSFVSEVEDIDILDRKYAWGESGMAEMCMMHCKNRGRGHIHLVPCATQQIEACLVGHLVEGMYCSQPSEIIDMMVIKMSIQLTIIYDFDH